jgi:YbbR domain-containing protein
VKGEQAVPVKVKWDLSPVRLVQVEPQEVEISLEQIVSEKFTVQVNIDGDPPLGYKRGEPTHEPAEVTVSGPESIVTRVASVHATLNIGGANESVKSTLPLETADENGNPVNGVTITPRTVTVTQPITLQGGYKNVVVKVVTTGQVATGYRLTNISVSPPNVTVFSTNPDLVNELPGYVETLPLDLTGLNDDIDIRMALNLPSDVSLVGEQSVLVQVGVAAIEGSLTVSLPVETLGLPPDLQASISPAGVDVIVSGPLPILDGLTPASFRAVIDVTGLAPGDYQLSPVVDLAPDAVRVQTVLPETVEVVIAPAPTPAPATLTPTVTAQP